MTDILTTDQCGTCEHEFSQHIDTNTTWEFTPGIVLGDLYCRTNGCHCGGFKVIVEEEPVAVASMVIHPEHYNTGKIEVWDFIIDQDLPYCLGDAVKYIARCGKKDQATKVQDLEKAKAYIDREIQRINELV